jgi:antitoxin StbD
MKMTHIILSNVTASITELKKHPMATIKSAEGEPLAILSRNEPVFYCLSPRVYEAMLKALDNDRRCEALKRPKQSRK